jgi:hypothetical protein
MKSKAACRPVEEIGRPERERGDLSATLLGGLDQLIIAEHLPRSQ